MSLVTPLNQTPFERLYRCAEQYIDITLDSARTLSTAFIQVFFGNIFSLEKKSGVSYDGKWTLGEHSNARNY